MKKDTVYSNYYIIYYIYFVFIGTIGIFFFIASWYRVTISFVFYGIVPFLSIASRCLINFKRDAFRPVFLWFVKRPFLAFLLPFENNFLIFYVNKYFFHFFFFLFSVYENGYFLIFWRGEITRIAFFL